MWWHGQGMPPCHCVAKIAAEEYVSRRFLRDRRQMGRGGNRQNREESAHTSSKIVFLFSSFVFESAGSALEKKEADSKTAILILGKNKGQTYLASNFFNGCPP